MCLSGRIHLHFTLVSWFIVKPAQHMDSDLAAAALVHLLKAKYLRREEDVNPSYLVYRCLMFPPVISQLS